VRLVNAQLALNEDQFNCVLDLEAKKIGLKVDIKPDHKHWSKATEIWQKTL